MSANYMLWKATHIKQIEFTNQQKIECLVRFIMCNMKCTSFSKNWSLFIIQIYGLVLKYDLLEKLVTRIFLKPSIIVQNTTTNGQYIEPVVVFYKIFMHQLFKEHVKDCLSYSNKKPKLLDFCSVQRHHQQVSILSGEKKLVFHFLSPNRGF